MKIKLTQLPISLDYTPANLAKNLADKLQINPACLKDVTVTRRSIDARGIRGRVCFKLTVEAMVAQVVAEKVSALAEKLANLEIVDEAAEVKPLPDFSIATDTLAHRPVVVGAGPAGLLAAWQLAKAGAKPILIERGKPVEERKKSVGEFWANGKLDPEDNVLYGEGGAGLYSDGKLTTRSKLREQLRVVLELLVACGADESILIDAEPHVGSDRLAEVVPSLRNQIIELGGEVRFDSRLDDIEIADGKIVTVTISGERVQTNHCLLATGHSARDIYKMLHTRGVMLAPKPFAAGVRIELPQQQIDYSQFRNCANHPRLGAASFRLTRKPDKRYRACYSFCMCPGGSVISCASSAGLMTTNGMSLSARSQTYGNAAFLVPVDPADFGASESDPLAGIAWQEKLEALAFSAGGSDYTLPANMLEEFLAGRVAKTLPQNRSCNRATPADLRKVLPDFISKTLTHAVPLMLRKLGKVRVEDGIIYAAETRSSSPVRIVRGEDFQSPTTAGLYPAGEGAGYAGGIVTSAIDGLRAAQAMLERLK